MKLSTRIIIYVAGILGAVLRFTHTYIASMENGWLNTLTWGYNALPSFVLAVAVFVFAKQFIEKTVKSDSVFAKCLSWLSGTTFGIYLMHIFVMRNLISVFDIDNRLLWWRLGGPIILFIICLVGVKIIQKIPVFGKYIIPS